MKYTIVIVLTVLTFVLLLGGCALTVTSFIWHFKTNSDLTSCTIAALIGTAMCLISNVIINIADTMLNGE